MFLKNVSYILSSPSKKYWLDNSRKEICIVGRSNVGKSTFINKICNHNSLAKVSGTPGYTKYLNFFDVNKNFYLVDTPGYGYAKLSASRDESFVKMMQEYIYEREKLICIILLVDAKVGITNDDILLLNMAHDAKRNVQIIASKSDKLNQSLKYKFLKSAKEILNENEFSNMILYSSLDKNSIEKVVDRILFIYNS
ncbi:MAG: ribosome biogenesis GTP-binding protein YihA/YsxC [Erysipelotrichaceae bacterium]|nr:ribosome biogenesis GTP-binding protein YihA/YsxC [Erysipelotrichaceae bacterium]